jgi:GT2 family glycosyltransferase
LSSVVVTVTYGDRLQLLIQALSEAKAQGLGAAIVVDNGSCNDISGTLGVMYGEWCKTLSLERNYGSAFGFHQGMKAALEAGHEEILLLDDDNLLNPGAVSLLRLAWSQLPGGDDLKAVFALREDHGGDRARDAASGRQIITSVDTFSGFHVLDILKKVSRRFNKSPELTVDLTGLILECPTAPYGGLFFHRALLARVGLPQTQFILYHDDTEFTARIVAQGGKLCLVCSAKIRDIDQSWHASGGHKSNVSNWVLSGSDLKIYYSMRNSVYWEVHCRGRVSIIYFINMIAYLTILLLSSIWTRRMIRGILLVQATVDGLRRRMGENSRFKLA